MPSPFQITWHTNKEREQKEYRTETIQSLIAFILFSLVAFTILFI